MGRTLACSWAPFGGFLIIALLLFCGSVPTVEGITVNEFGESQDFPFLVSIQVLILRNKWRSNYQHICAGTILSSSTILTAAHCFRPNTPPPEFPLCTEFPADCFRIVAGQKRLLDLGTKDQSPYAQVRVFSMRDIKIHMGYDNFHYDNDIALIRLESRLNVNTPYVHTIKLVNPEIPYSRAPVFIAGWGARESEQHPDDILRKASLRILTDEECFGQWGHDYHSETMMCATNSTQFNGVVADACQGDSGGPLVARNLYNENESFVVGIISWGHGCGVPDYPGLYAKVAKYLPWIKAHMRRRSYLAAK